MAALSVTGTYAPQTNNAPPTSFNSVLQEYARQGLCPCGLTVIRKYTRMRGWKPTGEKCGTCGGLASEQLLKVDGIINETAELKKIFDLEILKAKNETVELKEKFAFEILKAKNETIELKKKFAAEILNAKNETIELEKTFALKILDAKNEADNKSEEKVNETDDKISKMEKMINDNNMHNKHDLQAAMLKTECALSKPSQVYTGDILTAFAKTACAFFDSRIADDDPNLPDWYWRATRARFPKPIEWILFYGIPPPPQK